MTQKDKKAASPEEKPEEIPEDPIQALMGVLKAIDGAPNQGQVDKWKTQYGNIYCTGFSEQEIYIFRPLARKEYQVLQAKQQTAALKQQKMNDFVQGNIEAGQWGEVEKAIDEDLKKSAENDEEIIKQCVLWPKLSDKQLESKAGTVPVLMEQIMQNSNFLTPQQASALVIKL